MTDFLPPQAPDAEEDRPPTRWEAHPRDGGDRARMVVAAKAGAAPVVQAGEHPPRNGHALWSLGVAVGGLALLLLSVGVAGLVTLAFALIAVQLGRRGRARAVAEGIGGYRAARWGVTLGIVLIVLSVLVMIGWILVLVFDWNVTTDVGRDSPSAPTDLSTIAALLRGHL
jgi:hypothetical protein